jgi:uncharacterized protein (TIGR04255 family)
MSDRHYPNPPITEAVLALRVPTSEIAVSELLKMSAGEEAAYPTAQPLQMIMSKMTVGPTPAASTTQQQTGFVFRRQDGRYIYQARLDGFTISQLPRYSDWADFRTEASLYWQRYQEITQPAGVTRTGLRYVNRIDVPIAEGQEHFEVTEYLLTAPKIAPELPQMMQGFFMQIALPWPDTECRAMITETIIPPARPGFFSLILDIDTFREYPTPATHEQAWQCLEELHSLKNKVFEACITDKARELFK